MSDPYRGDDIVSDKISHQNVQDFKSAMDKLRPQLELVDLLDRIGGDKLVEEVFGKLEPRNPGEQTLLDDLGTSELCTACRSIFTTETEISSGWFPGIKEQTRHHANVQDLQTAAENGCHICLILWHRITGGLPFKNNSSMRNRPLEDLVDYITYSVGGGIAHEDGVYTLHFVYKGHLAGMRNSKSYRLTLCMLPLKSLSGVVNEHTVPPTTADENTFEFFRRCLKTCMQEHGRCCTNFDERWRPTRLIDLGCDGQESVRLDISSVPSKYVTLSHRWGSADVFKTTKAKLAKLQVSIEIDELPKTFVEAFTVCRKLGYRYIWIDSLCIVQDNEDDWRDEARLMGKIYAHADLNISATGAQESNSGLFVQREAKLVAPVKVVVSKPGSTFNIGAYYVLDPKLWSAGVSEAPLNSRGWVFQERVLARRVLHFGRDQLYYECQQNDACESFPHGLPTIPTYTFRALGAASNGNFKRLDPMVDGRRLREAKTETRQCVDESLNPYFLWSELVEMYSGTQLTNATDKLIAVSGIAQQVQRVLNDDQYLAGLWRRHLPYHLLWSKRKHLRSGTNSVEYCAPSWSWASIKDQVDMYPVSNSSEDEVILVDIIEAEVVPVGEDPTGQLAGGYVRLCGPLQPARWAFYFPGEEWTISDLIPRLTFPGSEKPAGISVWEDEWDRLGLVRPEDGEGPPENLSDVFCLPIHVWWRDGDVCTNGLLLEPIEWDSYPSSLSVPRLFRRVGKFKINRANVDDHAQFYGFDRTLMVDRDSGNQTPKSTRAAIEAHLDWHEITII